MGTSRLCRSTSRSSSPVSNSFHVTRSKKAVAIRGLNRNYNHDLKNIFKGAATWAASNNGPFQSFYEARLARGMPGFPEN